MTVAGVDFDTFGAYVVVARSPRSLGESATFPGVELSYEPLVAYEFAFSGARSFDRLRNVLPAFPPSFWEEVDLVGIEDPRATNPLMRSVIGKLARVQGAIVQTIPSRVRVEPFNAKEWRVAAGLKGNATKEEVYEWAVGNGFYLSGGATARQDLADAYCLLRAAQRLASGDWSRPLKAPRRRKAA